MKEGTLIVFLQNNKFTGAVSNINLTPAEAMDIYLKAPPEQFPIYIKKAGHGRVGIMLDCVFRENETNESLLRVLEALSELEKMPTG